MGNPFEDLRQAVVVRPMNSPGPQGAAAPHMKVKYSADGTSWHNDPVETDRYLSFSTDNGITWSDAIYFNNLSETLEWVEKARQWAENPENDEVESGQYSALHHALQAKKAEITAGEYAIDAAGSANEAFGAAAPAWDSATTYSYNDVVSFDNGHTYRCIGSNVTTPPNADGVDDEVNWTRITVAPEGFFEYDTNYDLQPVIAPVATTGPWMLDELGDIQPRLDPDLAVSELDELISESVSKLAQSAGDEITLRSLIASAGSTPMSITIYDDIPITDDLIVPENIELNFKLGGKLSVSATKTLTINGPFSAGLYQVFSGDGSVTFGSGSVSEVFPEWWGIDGTSDETEINKAINSLSVGGDVILSNNAYSIDGTIVMASKVRLIGKTVENVGEWSAWPGTKTGQTYIKLENNANCDMISIPITAYSTLVKGLYLDGNKANNAGTLAGIKFESSSIASNKRGGNSVENCVISFINGYGIYVGERHYETYLKDVKVMDNALDGLRYYNTQDNTLIRVQSGANGRNGIIFIGTVSSGSGADRLYNCDFHNNGQSLTGNEHEGSGMVIQDNYMTLYAFGLVVNNNKYNGLYLYNSGVGTGTPTRMSFVGCKFFGNSQALTNTYSNVKLYSATMTGGGAVNFSSCFFELMASGTVPKYGVEDASNTPAFSNTISNGIFFASRVGTASVNQNVETYWHIDETSIDTGKPIRAYIDGRSLVDTPTTPSAGDIRYDGTTRKHILVYGAQGHTTEWRSPTDKSFVFKNANYTAALCDDHILVDANSSAITITLPALTDASVGKVYIIQKNDSSANAVIVAPAAGDGNIINHTASVSIATQFEALYIIHAGTGWMASKLLAP